MIFLTIGISGSIMCALNAADFIVAMTVVSIVFTSDFDAST